MTKEELQLGYFVKTRGGKSYIIIEMHGKKMLFNALSSSEIDEVLKDNLTGFLPENDIVEVSIPRIAMSGGLDFLMKPDVSSQGNEVYHNWCDTIYMNQEIVLTMQDIANKFGIPVEKLKIKK